MSLCQELPTECGVGVRRTGEVILVLPVCAVKSQRSFRLSYPGGVGNTGQVCEQLGDWGRGEAVAGEGHWLGHWGEASSRVI